MVQHRIVFMLLEYEDSAPKSGQAFYQNDEEYVAAGLDAVGLIEAKLVAGSVAQEVFEELLNSLKATNAAIATMNKTSRNA